MLGICLHCRKRSRLRKKMEASQWEAYNSVSYWFFILLTSDYLRNKHNSQRSVVFLFPYTNCLFLSLTSKLELKWVHFLVLFPFIKYQFYLVDLYVTQISHCLTVKNKFIRLRNAVRTGFAYLSEWLYLWCSLKTRGSYKDGSDCHGGHCGTSLSPKAF